MDREAVGHALMARLEALAAFSERAGELTRLYLTPEHRAAVDQVRAWMEAAGLHVSLDAAGTVVGRYEAATPNAPALLLGSHIDTVRNAGRYDGALGIVVAIEAVGRLAAAGLRFPWAIEVLAFGDEEGVRFPATLTGSKALAGALDTAALEARDADGVSLREALSSFGLDPEVTLGLARQRKEVLGFIEVHIEQGPVLEAEDLPIGIVTGIAGAARFTIEIAGEAGHAGTVPMAMRKDALAAAAEMVLAIERKAGGTPGIVATVGRLEARPGAVNVVPGGVRMTLDIRSAADDLREAATARLQSTFEAIARRRGLGLEITKTYDQAAAPCAPGLVAQLEASVWRAGIRPLRLPSGAGHDGLAMAGLCPIGMLFVRCAGGISHSPAERITAADAAIAAEVLHDFLLNFQPVT